MTFCAVTAFLGMNVCQDQVALNLVENQFNQHIASYGISYGTKEEYNFRFAIYSKKEEENQVINANLKNTFTVGHNQFSTWTETEYKKLLGYRGPQTLAADVEVVKHNTTLAANVDWRPQGVVNTIKNQGQCGSCWAFSATAAIEGHNALKTGTLLSLAEQQMVDCDKKCAGCNGGWQSYAMNYVHEHPQRLETEYPYTAKGGFCKTWNPFFAKGHVTVSLVNNVAPGTSEALKAAISVGPVSVTIEADTSVFQRYTSGVLNSADCGTQLDHAVTAVGYGVDAGQEFYIVRNSWGASWGEAGYIKIATQASGDGICGIQQVSVYPDIQ